MADEEEEKGQLPARVSRLKQQLQAAAATMGPAQGRRAFLKVDDRTGALTVGVAQDPFPTRARYAVNLRTVKHGYVVFGESGGTREAMVAMVEQPAKPIPPGGYSERFGEPGAKDCVRIELQSLDEPGYGVTFDALGKSNTNRVRQLFYDSLAHMDTAAGERGYVHPVIRAFAGHYFHREQGREIHHFDYEVADWLYDGDEGIEVSPDGGGGPPLLWSEAQQDEPTAAPWAAEEPRQAPRRARA
jgi:hypothetical protein